MPKSSLSREFDTKVATLWSILTDPKYSADYMFNCSLTTDWTIGSEITWQGEYQGYKAFQTGKVLAFEPTCKVSYTTFDPNIGLKDEAKNYIQVTYLLKTSNGKANLVIENETFDGNEERMAHITQGWEMVLEKLEQIVKSLT